MRPGVEGTKLYFSLTVMFMITALGLLMFLSTSYKQDFIPVSRTLETTSKVVADNRTGAVLSFYVYEQMGNGATNLMNLQCWAGSLNMQVVEPSIRKSGSGGDGVFYFTQDYKTTQNFRLLFDFDHWNRYSTSHGFSPLISMETFLLKASRNVIFVELMYSSSVKCSKSLFHLVTENIADQFFKHSSAAKFSFLSSQGFRIVRKVCIDLLQDDRLRTQEEFNRLIFGDLFGNGNYTVIFDEWRALRNENEREGKLSFVKPGLNHYRILVKDSRCTYESLKLRPYYTSTPQLQRNFAGSEPMEPDYAFLKESKLGLIPSYGVSRNAERYRAKYLDNKPYLAIVMRMENLHRGISDSNIYHECLKKVKSLWGIAVEKYNLKHTFLTSDLGKYGSFSWTAPSQLLSAKFQQDIIRTTNMSSSYTDTLDSSFEDITHADGRVEVAWTQSIVAANARCVIFLGGGAFHGLLYNLNGALHMNRECFIAFGEECTNDYLKLGFN